MSLFSILSYSLHQTVSFLFLSILERLFNVSAFYSVLQSAPDCFIPLLSIYSAACFIQLLSIPVLQFAPDCFNSSIPPIPTAFFFLFLISIFAFHLYYFLTFFCSKTLLFALFLFFLCFCYPFLTFSVFLSTLIILLFPLLLLLLFPFKLYLPCILLLLLHHFPYFFILSTFFFLDFSVYFF